MGGRTVSLWQPIHIDTPNLKLGDSGILLHIDLGKGKRWLGGSALVQVFGQVGNESPDLDDVPYLKTNFNGVQELLGAELISAGHDISDGGLIVCSLEMTFAGNCGISLDLTLVEGSPCQTLFAEELGLLLEVNKKHLDTVMAKFSGAGISAEIIGSVTVSPVVKLKIDGVTISSERTCLLRVPVVRIYTAAEVENELEVAKKEFLQATVGISTKKKVVAIQTM